MLFDSSVGDFASVQTRDVSPGGMYLVVDSRMMVGTRLRLALAKRETGHRTRVSQLLEVQATVSWVGDDGVGVAFDEPPAEFLAELARQAKRAG